MWEPRSAAISRGVKEPLPRCGGCKKQQLGSARSFLEPIGAPAQVPLAFRNFFARWLKHIVLFALVAFLPRARFVVGFRFLWPIGGHEAQ
jgi:hypothetical protein